MFVNGYSYNAISLANGYTSDMIGLETDRLIFRQWTMEDLGDINEFYSNEKESRYVGGPKKPEEAWRLMATYIGHYQLLGYSYLAIDNKESNELIGTIGLWNSDPWPEPEMGYWLLPTSRGKGYGQEAAIIVRDYALNQLQLPSLVSYINPANEPSKKLAQKVGARYDKTIELLDYGPHEVFRHA